MIAQTSAKTLNTMTSKASLFKQRHLSVPTAFNTSEAESVKLPEIPKDKYQRAVVSGTGVDELFTKREDTLFKMVEELKLLKQENMQIKKVNEKLVDRMELLNQKLDGEAAAGKYYYGHKEENNDVIKADTGAKKDDKKDNELQK